MLFISGCAETREPIPIEVKHEDDKNLTCEQIAVEYKSNTTIAAEKIKKNNSDDGKDVLLGILIFPTMADFKNADGIEGNALLDRNTYLKEIALQKGCDISNLPEQPERYD